MLKSSALRVASSSDGVSIWSTEIFRDTEAPRLREFLARAFSVQEVDQVELRRTKSFGRIRFGRTKDRASIMRKLGRALRGLTGLDSENEPGGGVLDAGSLYLEGPLAGRVHITRVGETLTTWRVRKRGAGKLRLAHPSLRNRRDIAFRLEEVLVSIVGIETFSTNAITGRVSIRFDERLLTVEHLTKELEKAWPKLLEGLDGPPSTTRLVAATGLLGLAVTGQFFVPAVRPIALAGTAIYAAPNVLGAVKDLSHGQIRLPALYTTGLAFMLVSGMPMVSTVFATVMQLWPYLGRRKMVRGQRRVFAEQRRRPLTARLARTGQLDVEVHVDDVRMNDLVIVRSGETVPVDGIVEQGMGLVIDAPPFGGDRAEDCGQGDAVGAGALVIDGNLTIRVQRTGEQTSASYLESLLPHAPMPGMPSLQKAERIANRNAKPALALAAVSWALTQSPRLTTAILRPDYITAPRLSAQFSAFYSVAEGLQRGVVFRNTAALDRLSDIDAYILDDNLDLGRGAVKVAGVKTARGISPEQVLGYAIAAQQGIGCERSRALAGHATSFPSVCAPQRSVQRLAGITRYHDDDGDAIEVVSPQYLGASGITIPTDLRAPDGRRRKLGGRYSKRVESLPARIDDHPSMRPLWVLRNGAVLGSVTFDRSGTPIGRDIVTTLRDQHPSAQFLLVSQRGQAHAEALAATLGMEAWHGGLSPAEKVNLVRGLGGKTAWIGDGADPEAQAVIAASAVGISTSLPLRFRDDAGDILLPYRGLAGVPDVIDIGQKHARRLSTDYRAVYASNLLGVATALGAYFSSLHVGLISQLAAIFVYGRHARELNRLAASVEARRAEVLRLSAEASSA